MTPVDIALARAFRWLVAGLLASIPLLLVDGTLTTTFLLHLTAVVIFGMGLAVHLLPLAERDWFPSVSRPFTRDAATAAGITIVVTGVVGLVTLASSAALRFDPSTQFLQLLSTLDIAWATTALMVGVLWLKRQTWAIGAGAMLTVVCIWSIARYIDAVGFGPGGEWIVRSNDLLTFVLPYDTMAAVLAIGSVLLGIRRRQPTAQARPQS